jgi:AbrB family looped-hinge helix DNA binding protein
MSSEVKRPRRNRIRLSSKNQITIPVSVLREMGVRPGDELEIVAKGREATIRPAGRPPWLKHVGSLTGVWPAGHLDALRDEWDRSQPMADLDATA